MIVAVAVLTGLAIYNAVTTPAARPLRRRRPDRRPVARHRRPRPPGGRTRPPDRGARRPGRQDRRQRRREDARRHRVDHRRTRRARHPGASSSPRPSPLHELKFAGAKLAARAPATAPTIARKRPPSPAASRPPAAAADNGRERDDRGRPRRDRCQPHRSLSAADRDAAAAQGALLRGADAAAHRGGRRAAAGRFPRSGRGRRPDAADRQPAAVPLRAGGAPAAAQEPRDRPVLQHLAPRR